MFVHVERKKSFHTIKLSKMMLRQTRNWKKSSPGPQNLVTAAVPDGCGSSETENGNKTCLPETHVHTLYCVSFYFVYIARTKVEQRWRS